VCGGLGNAEGMVVVEGCSQVKEAPLDDESRHLVLPRHPRDQTKQSCWANIPGVSEWVSG